MGTKGDQGQKKTDTEKDTVKHEETFSQDESNKKMGELHKIGKEQEKEEDLTSKLEQYIALTEQLQKEAEENHQQLLRARADLENFRRRSRKETEDMVKYAPLSLIESLLPVMDNFERALEAVDKNEHTQSLYEGVEMVYRQLQSALQNAGLERIEAKGNAFDPHQHNAVMQEEMTDVEPGVVVEEMQTGYRFLERVARPTIIKVSK
jgi:molecular chaperone GrpE